MELSEINYQPLFDWINKSLNTDCEFKIDIFNRQFGILSPNLTEYSEILNVTYNWVSVDIFNFSVLDNGFSGRLCMRFTSWTGGKNSVLIGEWEFNEVAGWKAMMYKDHKWEIL
tara:strand:+ start:1643 stop:1984 length:342 start_codon:yes stop_codon:yes gene_type:complete